MKCCRLKAPIISSWHQTAPTLLHDHVSCVTCHVSCVMCDPCHVSCVACVMCHVSCDLCVSDNKLFESVQSQKSTQIQLNVEIERLRKENFQLQLNAGSGLSRWGYGNHAELILNWLVWRVYSYFTPTYLYFLYTLYMHCYIHIACRL